MSNKLFTQVPIPKFPSSTFSLSRSVMFTPRLQKLYCTNIIETIPGDGINERSEQFARTQPMVAPTFAKMNADQFAFFVPFWQLNEHFDDFITGGEKGDYQDKLPFMTVNDVYAVIVRMLSCNTTSSHFGSLVDSDDLTYIEYNILLEYAQSVIEHVDLLRAVPVTLPDFVIASSSISKSDLKTLYTSNINAFTTLNSRLSGSTLRVNFSPFLSYLKVWCEYFRDENLCEDYFDSIIKTNQYGSISLYSGSGQYSNSQIITIPNASTGSVDDYLLHSRLWCALLGVLPRAWKKDYFTAALPFTQKGPEVLIPLAGTFPVDFKAASMVSSLGDPIYGSSAGGVDIGINLQDGVTNPKINAQVTLDSSGIGATIQDLRRAFRLEEFYEADARGGNRYPENTLMQYGVRTPDSRLPRSIFLGSNNSPIQISEVVQTSSTSGQPTPQGTLAGKGISYGNNRLSSYYYTMHGFLLNFYSVRVHAIYEQGIHPMFSRFDRTEYAWPRFAHLGEQPVYTKELYVDSTSTETEVFGYEPRYSEYKSEKSSLHGTLKGSLNFWTMSRRFASKPVLNEEFIYNPPRLDNFAVVNPLQSPLIVEIDYRVRANRKLPFFGVPML